MNILVFNCGSSSLNYKLYATTGPSSVDAILGGKAHRVGVIGTEPSFIEHRRDGRSEQHVTPLTNHRQAGGLILAHLKSSGITIDCVGHRFVHGGSQLSSSVMLTPETLAVLKPVSPMAPIHNPNSLSLVDACEAALPGVPQYASFDTAFHAAIPEYARTYALPRALDERFGFRKYGFHGLSYQYATAEAARFLGRPLSELRIVACHLGTGGSSVVAVRDGRALDTSMGYTPLPGLVMSTRCGDLDPTLPVYLMAGHGATPGLPPADVTRLFNNRSGLLGVSGAASDIRDLIRRRNEEGDARAGLAVALYIHRLKKYIGGYVTLLGGLDALVFTDDIGVQNWQVREGACQDMDWCGIVLDRDRNRRAAADRITRLDAETSCAYVMTVPPDEERVVALEGLRLWREVPHADL